MEQQFCLDCFGNLVYFNTDFSVGAVMILIVITAVVFTIIGYSLSCLLIAGVIADLRTENQLLIQKIAEMENGG